MIAYNIYYTSEAWNFPDKTLFSLHNFVPSTAKKTLPVDPYEFEVLCVLAKSVVSQIFAIELQEKMSENESALCMRRIVVPW